MKQGCPEPGNPRLVTGQRDGPEVSVGTEALTSLPRAAHLTGSGIMVPAPPPSPEGSWSPAGGASWPHGVPDPPDDEPVEISAVTIVGEYRLRRS